MKGKKLLAGILSAVMVLGTMVMPAFADEDRDNLNDLITAATTSEITLTKDAEWNANITRDITIDLNGKTVYLTKATPSTVYVAADVTFKNGNIVAKDRVTSANALIVVYPWAPSDHANLTFEGINFTADGNDGGYAAVIQALEGTFKTKAYNGTKTVFNVTNAIGGNIIQRDNNGIVELEDTEIYGDNITGGLLNIASIKNCKIELKNIKDDNYGIAASTVTTTIDNSTIEVTNCGRGAVIYPAGKLNFSNSSSLTVTNSTYGDIMFKDNATPANGIVKDDSSTITGAYAYPPYASVVGGYAVIGTERIYGDVTALINKSLKVELWTDTECIATTELKDGNQGDGDMIDGTEKTVTFGFNYDADSDLGSDYWTGNSFYPTIEKRPVKVKVYVDGQLKAEGGVSTPTVSGYEDPDYKWNEVPVVYAPAKIGTVGYVSLEAALAAAQDGDEITMYEDGEAILHNTLYEPVKKTNASVIDLNGNVMTINDDHWYFHNQTIKSGNGIGTVKITKQDIAASGVFELHNGGDLTFENVVIDATAVRSGYSIITKTDNSNGKINFINSEIKADSTGELGIIVDDTGCSEINFTNTKMTVDNVDTNVIRGGKITINADDPKYEFKFNNVKRGLYLYDTGSLTVNGKAVVNVNAKVYGIVLGADTPYTVADTATVNASVYRTPSATNIADAMKVSFADATAENAEGEKVYNIFVEADSDKTINRLTAVQLGLKLDDSTTGDFAMTVSNADGATAPETNGVYLFNFDGETRPSVTGTKIKIGQVKLVGYGTFTLSIDAAKDNKAHTLTNEGENLVTDFVPSPANGEGSLDISAKLDNISVAIATRKLTVKIDFNHEVKNQAAEYQAMTVTVTGPKGFTKTVKLGNGTDATPIVNNKATVVFDNELTLNTGYTVEVAGDGYRTAPYYVSMDSDKTLTFWNNYKDTAVKVEGRADEVAKHATFLAGEIVKDGKINIYDLSAVVSYFGMNTNTAAVSDYAKYDLDRNGIIDSKDVAYVLASWGY